MRTKSPLSVAVIAARAEIIGQAICELDATAHPPPQHNQLMSERRVLCLKSAL
jgi:hypothetical protein